MEQFVLIFKIDDKVVHIPSGRIATVYRINPLGVRHAFSIKWNDTEKTSSIFGKKKCKEFKIK